MKTADETPRGGGELLVLGAAVALLAIYLAGYLTIRVTLPNGSETGRGELLAVLMAEPELSVGGWFGDGTQPWGLLDRAGVVLLAVILWGVAGGAGWLVLGWIGLARHCWWEERVALSLGLGVQLTSLATLAAGLAGGLNPLAILAALVLLLAGCYGLGRMLTSFWPEEPELPAAEPESRDAPVPLWLMFPALAIVALPVGLMLLGAMLPPLEFDVREYHLQVPKEWFLRGRIEFLPHNVYGNMPLGAEMQALAAMTLAPGERGWWWGALAGKLANAAWPLITALALFAAGRRLGSPAKGYAAAAIYLSLPWVGHVAMLGLNEAALAGHGWLALYAALRGLEFLQTRDKEEDTADDAVRRAVALRWCLLAGLLAGGAASVKYTGLVFVMPPLALLAAWNNGRWNWQLPLALALAAGLSCGLWYAKNAALAGNPVYPLAASTLGGATRTPELIERWDRVHRPQPDESGNRFSPGQAIDGVGNLVIAGLLLSPVLWPLAVVGLFLGRPLRLQFVLGLGLVLLTAAWWLFTHRLERFWFPAWPLAAMLAGLGAGWGTSNLWRGTMLAAVGLAVLVAGLLLGSPVGGDNRFFVALDALRLDLPAADSPRSGRLSPTHHWLNVQGGRGVLAVGEAQVFDLERPTLYSTCFDPCVFEELTRPDVESLRTADAQQAAAISERLRARLDQLGIDHVYVHWGEIARYRSPGNYGFTDFVQPEVFALLVRHGVLEPPVKDIPTAYGEIYPVRPP